MCEYIHSGLWSSLQATVASRRLRISDFLFSVIRSEFDELGTEKVQLLLATQQAVLGIQVIFSGSKQLCMEMHAKVCSCRSR